MQDLIEFVQAHSALVGQSYRIVADQRPDGREPEMRTMSDGWLRRNMRTTADGDSRSRVPSCGRRYADAPTAGPFTARGGGEFPPSYVRQ